MAKDKNMSKNSNWNTGDPVWSDGSDTMISMEPRYKSQFISSIIGRKKAS